MAIIKNIKGRLINVEQNLFPEFTPFGRSLKKIYGNDFFDDKHDETPDFDGYVLLRSAEVYHGDTDGDIPRTGRCPFIAPDPVKMIEKLLGDKKYENVGKASNLAARCTKLKYFKILTSAQLKEAIRRYNHNITIDLWKNNDGTTTAIYRTYDGDVRPGSDFI